MAATAITNTVLTRNSVSAFPSTSAVDATDGALVTCEPYGDHKILLILENSDSSTAKTATIKAGNGLQGVSDLAVSIAASTTKCISVESGKFANVKGTDKGKILIKGTDAKIKVAAIVLP